MKIKKNEKVDFQAVAKDPGEAKPLSEIVEQSFLTHSGINFSEAPVLSLTKDFGLVSMNNETNKVDFVFNQSDVQFSIGIIKQCPGFTVTPRKCLHRLHLFLKCDFCVAK